MALPGFDWQDGWTPLQKLASLQDIIAITRARACDVENLQSYGVERGEEARLMDELMQGLDRAHASAVYLLRLSRRRPPV